jgi:hypothetical protein
MDNDEYAHSIEKELIDMKENYEVEYWTKKFGVSREELQEAVDAVGTSPDEVRKYLM